MSNSAPDLMPDPTKQLRRWVYLLLILISFGMITGHIIGVEQVLQPRLMKSMPAVKPEPQPTHADNDRSRWATIRALVEENTYVIGVRAYLADAEDKYVDQGQIIQSGWRTIDKVLQPTIGWRNENPQPGEPIYAKYFFSSKPPLLPTVLAGEYWLLNK